jgi:DnaJ domain
MGGYFGSAYAEQPAQQQYTAAAGLGRDAQPEAQNFAEQLRQRMGEEFQPDTRFMEETWTMGIDAAAENWRTRRQGQAERERQSQAFREMDSVGAQAFAQASAWYAQMRGAGTTTAIVERSGEAHDLLEATDARSRAEWLQRCAEDPFGGWRPREESTDEIDDDPDAQADAQPEQPEPHSMTAARAMRLLGLTAASTREQMRAAYRRMAGEFHPDRVAGRAESIRQAATDQMAEINEAYRVLRAALR